MKVPPIQSVQWFYGAFSFREAEVLLFYWLWAVPLNNLTTTCNIEPKTGVFAILCCALISMHKQHCLEYVVLQGGTKHCLSELPGLKILCFAQILCRDTDHIPRDAVVPSVSWLEFSFVLASCIYLLTKAQSVDPQVLKWTPVNLSVCWYLLRDDSADVSQEEKVESILVARSWPAPGSDWVFPSSLPRGLHLSQSHSVSDVGVVEVKSYMTTPINLVILDRTLGCNWLILQIFSLRLMSSALSFLIFFILTRREV